jgi:thymidylate kinase
MIHLVEGPDGVGKTTLARLLSSRSRIPYVEDLGKGRVEDPAVREAVYVAHVSILEQLSLHVDLVADRGWISTIAFCRSYGRPVPPFLLDPVGYARKRAEVEIIYRVEASVETALRRMHQRGEKPDGERLELEFAAFDELFRELYVAGIPVIYVDGQEGQP